MASIRDEHGHAAQLAARLTGREHDARVAVAMRALEAALRRLQLEEIEGVQRERVFVGTQHAVGHPQRFARRIVQRQARELHTREQAAYLAGNRIKGLCHGKQFPRPFGRGT